MSLWRHLWWTRAYFNVKRNFQEENIFTQHDVENKQLKEDNEKLKKEENEKVRKEENEKLRKEKNEQLRKNNIVKDADVKESIEIKSLEEDKNATDSYPNWFDKNKFKNILAIINSNKFNYRHKIGEFKYIDIKDLVNKIRNIQLYN